MAHVTWVPNTPVINYMKGWNGDIGRAVDKLANGIALGQRFLLAPHTKTGKLLRSVSVGHRLYGVRGIEVKVGANPTSSPVIGVAYWNDQGTRPHVIRPKADNRSGLLVFFWARVGHTVYLPVVHHPGNRANDWVMKGAGAAMAAWSPDPTGLVIR